MKFQGNVIVWCLESRDQSKLHHDWKELVQIKKNPSATSVTTDRAKSMVRGRREKERNNDWLGVDSSEMLTLHNFLSLAKISLMTDMLMVCFSPARPLSVSHVSSVAVAFTPLSIFLSLLCSSSFLHSGNMKDRVTPVIVAWWGSPLDCACHPMPNDDRKTWHHPQLPWRDFPTDNATLTSPASKGSSKAAKPSCQIQLPDWLHNTPMPVYVSPHRHVCCRCKRMIWK